MSQFRAALCRQGSIGELLNLQDWLALVNLRAGGHLEVGYGAGLVGLDGVLHLHGLEHHDNLTLFYFLALFDGDLDDAALHWCGDGITRHICLGATAATLIGLLALLTTAEQQVARQSDLNAAAANLDDELLGGVVLVTVRKLRGLGVLR